MHRELKARLLRRACDIVGGRESLALHLGVEAHSLEFWLAGRATPPDRVFMAVVDLVLADDIARALAGHNAVTLRQPSKRFDSA